MVFGRLVIVVVIAIVLFDPQTALAQNQKQPTAVGSGGAAATVDLDGTRAAIQALRDGGNAVDAAVAAASVLGVTEPFSCGIGGGGFMVIRTARGKVTTIDGREESPAAMRPDSFWENGTPLPFDDARFTGMSAGIPGTPATWDLALRRYGTWSLARALQPGIRVATDGFTVDSTFVSQTQPNVDWFNDIPSTAAIYLDPDGTPRDEGTTLRNPDLARTYRRLAENGVDWFYNDSVAGAMVRAAQDPPTVEDANHAWRPGLMRRSDVAAYRAIERAPTRIGYRGLDVWSIGPPSEWRLDGRRGAQHPRGLHEARLGPRARAPPDARVVALQLRRPQRLPRRPRLLRRPAGRPAVGQLRLRAPRAHRRAPRGHQPCRARRPLRQPGRPRRGGPGQRDGEPPTPVDHAPGRLRQPGQRRVVHVHDRVHRRERNRLAGLRLPHEQRADRLQLRLDDAPEPRRRRQAPAQLDEPDDPDEGRRAVRRGRVARRLDDPADRPAGAARAARPGRNAPPGDRAPARRPAERSHDDRGARFHRLTGGSGACRGPVSPHVQHDGRDRRGHGHRVPAGRPGAGGRRAGAPRRRQRRGGAALGHDRVLEHVQARHQRRPLAGPEHRVAGAAPRFARGAEPHVDVIGVVRHRHRRPADLEQRDHLVRDHRALEQHEAADGLVGDAAGLLMPEDRNPVDLRDVDGVPGRVL